MEDAVKHCTTGLGIWDWACNDQKGEPDVVMACAGDVPTLETVAAVVPDDTGCAGAVCCEGAGCCEEFAAVEDDEDVVVALVLRHVGFHAQFTAD